MRGTVPALNRPGRKCTSEKRNARSLAHSLFWARRPLPKSPARPTRARGAPHHTMRSRRRTREAAASALALACLLHATYPAAATLLSAVEAVTRGIGAKLQEFKGGEGLVVSPADIEGLLNSPCGESGWRAGPGDGRLGSRKKGRTPPRRRRRPASPRGSNGGASFFFLGLGDARAGQGALGQGARLSPPDGPRIQSLACAELGLRGRRGALLSRPGRARSGGGGCPQHWRPRLAPPPRSPFLTTPPPFLLQAPSCTSRRRPPCLRSPPSRAGPPGCP